MNNRQQNIAAILFYVLVITATALITACNRKDHAIVITDDMIEASMYEHVQAWEDDITNPDNAPYVLEVAFNLDIPVDSVTQAQFNMRYVRSKPYYLREQ